MEDKELEAFFKSMEAEEESKRQALLDEKDAVIEELKFERKLLFNDFLNIINEKLRLSSFNIFMGFNRDMFWKAWKWSRDQAELKTSLDKGDLTNAEYNEYETCFDVTTGVVKDKFFGQLKDQVKFKEIIMDWSVGYDFVYKYKRQEISIFVPIFNVDEKDYECALSGYHASYRKDECCNAWISSGLNYREVAEKLQAWMLAEG